MVGFPSACMRHPCLDACKVCFAPPPEHETEQVRLDRIKKAHAKMLKKGYNRKGVFGTGDS